MKTFEITGYGSTNSDQCSSYNINVSSNVTVEEVIKEILSAKGEWGTITVILRNLNLKNEYSIEYKNGIILPMSEYDKGKWHILQQFNVKSMRGYGGWSSSDYWLEVEIG